MSTNSYSRLTGTLAGAVFATMLSASVAFAQPPRDYSFDVVLRDTGSATIHTLIYDNPSGRGRVSVLAVHGLTERASMYEPLASAIFADPTLGRAVKRIVSIDLVGHGDSSAPSLPSPLKFSDLLIEDNISVLIQAIDKLRAAGFGADVVMGHSMGGLAIQGAQEALLAQGSSLKRHGIVSAILIDAVPARGSVWTQGPAADLSAFIVNDPELGVIFQLPAAAAGQAGGFTTLAGTLAPNTPSVATFVANDWVAPEPIAALTELTGTSAPLWRPFTRQNAFAAQYGTVLGVISGSQDVLTPAVDQDDLYTYLTGTPLNTNPDGTSDGTTGKKRARTLYLPIVASDAVHSMFISNPTGLLQNLRAILAP